MGRWRNSLNGFPREDRQIFNVGGASTHVAAWPTAGMVAPWDELCRELVACRACPRLVAWREQVAREKRRAFRDQEYWGKPVVGFGDIRGRLLIVGLAPGAHGSNRTGRMFTGDSSGETLYAALFRAGFANAPSAVRVDDGLCLRDAFITSIVRCVPPGNRPTSDEVNTCRTYVAREMDLMPSARVVLALGKLAFDQSTILLRHSGFSMTPTSFAHGVCQELRQGGTGRLIYLMASYHPSRQNTQTGRLTPRMMDQVFVAARALLDSV